MSFIDNIEQIIVTYPLLAFGAVFVAGVISSASPCVLSTIPLVVGFVGGYSDGDRLKAFRYSLIFILGLSLTFTVFGAAAGLFGTIFGVVGVGWYLFAGLLALLMGGQMMGSTKSAYRLNANSNHAAAAWSAPFYSGSSSVSSPPRARPR